MKGIPPIKSVMTAFPYWIDIDASIQNAETMMSEHDISHLPVKEGGEIVAVISKHDIEQACITRQECVDAGKLTVRDVCKLDVYKVDLNEPLDNVVLHMANEHIGSAVVMRNNRLAGVFTTNDACRYLSEFLRYHYRPSGGDDIA